MSASGNFTWPISAATVAQAKLLVYRQRTVRPENRLMPAGNLSSWVFLLSFLGLTPSRACSLRQARWASSTAEMGQIWAPKSHVFIDLYAKRQTDLLGNPGAAPAGIPLFHVDDSGDEFFARSLGSGAAADSGRKQQTVLSFSQKIVKVQERGRA